jgi:hypothetical protein
MHVAFDFNATEPVINDQNCAWWMVHGAEPEADSEITGIGIVVSFLLSAYITMGLAVAAYVLGAIDASLLGPVDLLVHRIPTRPRISAAWQEALDACVLLFSDQQIMTGLAVLIAGFVGLANRMDVYHFQIVIMLAWMSSSVNLTALTVLGRYFAEHKAVLYWRLGGMLTILTLLLVALVPTSSNHWALWATEQGNPDHTTGWAIPARCYYAHDASEKVNADAPLSYILLISSYVWKLCSLSKTSKSVFARWIRGPPQRFLESMIRMHSGRSQKRLLRYHICLVLYVDFLVIFEFAASFAASLWISILGLAYGTIQTLVPRLQNAKYFKSEDDWTFGQIVPLILLIQPIGAMLELYRSRENSEEDLGVAFIDTELHGLEAITAPAMEDTSTHEGQAVEFSSKDPPCPVVTLRSNEQDTTEPATDFRTIIFASRIFRVLITMTHISLTVFSGLIFALNAKTIGYSSAYNYLWILYALALHVMMLLITTGIAIPFSRVFRSDL